MAKLLSTSAQRVQDALNAAGVAAAIVEYDVAARTSAEAASVLRCSVAQIAKSLVFRAASGAPVLVIASGANRVDEAKVSAVIGEAICRADAAFVRERTGYAIGGIPPLGGFSWTFLSGIFVLDSQAGGIVHRLPCGAFLVPLATENAGGIVERHSKSE